MIADTPLFISTNNHSLSFPHIDNLLSTDIKLINKLSEYNAIMSYTALNNRTKQYIYVIFINSNIGCNPQFPINISKYIDNESIFFPFILNKVLHYHGNYALYFTDNEDITSTLNTYKSLNETLDKETDKITSISLYKFLEGIFSIFDRFREYNIPIDNFLTKTLLTDFKSIILLPEYTVKYISDDLLTEKKYTDNYYLFHSIPFIYLAYSLIPTKDLHKTAAIIYKCFSKRKFINIFSYSFFKNSILSSLKNYNKSHPTLLNLFFNIILISILISIFLFLFEYEFIFGIYKRYIEQELFYLINKYNNFFKEIY